MLLSEFSSEFDLLYNNIESNMAPGLTEYEKSVFLTQAQEQLVIELYNGQYRGTPFEVNEEVRVYLKALLKNITIDDPTKIVSKLPDEYIHYEVEINMEDLWFIVFESVILSDKCPCINGKKILVKPVSYDSYWSILRNPFKGPNQNRVLRVDRGQRLIELISKYDILEYTLEFLKQPKPIILDILTDGLSINGESKATECELPEVMHRGILLRAVQLAKSVWGQTQIQE